jgi:MCM P-loop domain
LLQDMAVDMIDSQDPFGLNNLVRTNLLTTEDRMVRLGRQADIYEKLTASLAPSIWSMDDVKKGILCQLFGATVKARRRLDVWRHLCCCDCAGMHLVGTRWPQRLLLCARSLGFSESCRCRSVVAATQGG